MPSPKHIYAKSHPTNTRKGCLPPEGGTVVINKSWELAGAISLSKLTPINISRYLRAHTQTLLAHSSGVLPGVGIMLRLDKLTTTSSTRRHHCDDADVGVDDDGP